MFLEIFWNKLLCIPHIITDIKWIDMLNGSVRPMLAYSFFFMYMSVKYLQYKAISASAHVIEYLDIIWTIDDQAIFAGVISFYYGQRTFKNFWKNKYTESK